LGVQNGVSVTVAAECYVAMLPNILAPQMEALGMQSDELYFPARWRHCTHCSKCGSCSESLPSVTSRVGDISWPILSPKMAVPNCCLWGYLENRVYRSRSHTTVKLKRDIRKAVATIRQDLLRRVFESFVNRLRHCDVHEAGHRRDGIYKR
jgi:hypothetical protein